MSRCQLHGGFLIILGECRNMHSTESSPNQHPIAALASASGAGAIAVLRVTGIGCHERLAAILTPVGQAPWSAQRMRLCRLRDHATAEVLDEPLAVRFNGPRSFTGEDAAEIYCHGGPYVVKR